MSMTGLGGDMFALFFDGITKKVEALNGSGRAPRALTADRVRREFGVGPEGILREGIARRGRHGHCAPPPLCFVQRIPRDDNL